MYLIISIQRYGGRREDDDLSLLLIVGGLDMVDKERHDEVSIGCEREGEGGSRHCGYMAGVLIKAREESRTRTLNGQVIRVGGPPCNEVLDGRVG
jgi:hypothetical protein